MNQIQTVNFHGDELPVVVKNGKQFVAMKPVAEAIGLDWSAQYRRIKRDSVLSKGIAIMATEVCQSGQAGEVVMLPSEYLNGWLFGVSENQVKPEIKEKLIRYKTECYQVLHDYWTKGMAVNERRVKELEAERRNLRKELAARDTEIKELQNTVTHYECEVDTALNFTIPDLQDEIGDLKARLSARRMDRHTLEDMVVQLSAKILLTPGEIWNAVTNRLKGRSHVNIACYARETGGYALAIEQAGLLNTAFAIVNELLNNRQLPGGSHEY